MGYVCKESAQLLTGKETPVDEKVVNW